MPLKFPNARLHVYSNLNQDNTSCVRAVVDCAYAYGLVSKGSLDELRLPLETGECGSVFAARRVLERCFAERGYELSSEGDGVVERTWLAIQSAVQKYMQDTSLHHERHPGQKNEAIDCGNMAPVMMDILLQHLLPYI